MTRTAIVTGCSQGVGLGIAKVFLKHGWRVFGVDQKLANEAVASYDGYVHAVVDLRDVKGCEQVMDDCLARFGGLDALVNNAGLGNRAASRTPAMTTTSATIR